MAADYIPRLREAANAPVTHAINSCGMPPMAVVAQADLTAALDELERLRSDVALPILRQAWRNGWSDRARAVRDAVRISDNERDTYERAFARYMSEDPAEADKDPYRPLDGPDDPAAPPPWCSDCPHGANAHRATTGCIRCSCNYGRTTASERPADSLTGAGEGQHLSTSENGPQQGSQGPGGEQ